ncbi:MAG: BON domain-containing protein [Planctomycetaceae bacterium]
MFATQIVVPLVQSSLAERVDAAIQTSPHRFGRQLRFEAADGHVVLQGRVGTYFQKQMAQETIRRVEGVETIDNHLEVNWQ